MIVQRIVMFETSSLINIAKGFLEGKGEIRDFFERLKKSVSQGEIKIVYTHVQIDEIKSEDEKKIINKLFEELKAELIPTRVAVYGFSRFDMCRFGSELEHQLYEKLKSSTSTDSRIRDLIQALTSIEVNILVTDDKGVRHAIRQIKSKFGEQMRCEPLSLNEFLKFWKNEKKN